MLAQKQKRAGVDSELPSLGMHREKYANLQIEFTQIYIGL